MKRISDQTGIRVVGPNCNGIYNANARLSIGFNTAHSKRIQPGDIAIFSHSGALFDAMVGQLATLGAGLSVFASSGNEADLDLLDYVEYAIAEPKTRVVALLLDSLSDGDRFRRLADRLRHADKHLVVLKIGTSVIGAQAAVAHSSRMAASGAAYAALFEAAGVPAVSSIESLMTSAALLSRYGKANGGLAALSSSGAGGSLLADLAAKYGVPLATLGDPTRAALTRLTRFSQAANPTDMGNFQGVTGREDVPSLIAADPAVGALMALVQSFHLGAHPLIKPFTMARGNSGKPFVVVAPGGFPAEERDQYVAGGLSILGDTEATMQGMAALLMPARAYPEPAAPPRMTPAADEPLFRSRRLLTEPESLSLLRRFGLDTVATHVCKDAEEAVVAANDLGWPVVVKAVVQGVAHKSDLGFVHVGVENAEALREICASFAQPATVAVQAMVHGKLEAIAGITKAAGVGTLLLAGLGGINAEALSAATLWPIPTTRADIEAKLAASALGRILTSPRWNDAASHTAFVEALLALQSLALWAGAAIDSVDVNPLLLGNGRAIAVDALIVPSPKETKL